MNPTPGMQLPTIREGTTLGFRFTVAQWAAIIGSAFGGLTMIIGACIWLYILYANVETMKESQKSLTESVQRIETSVREIEFRQKYGITTTLPASSRSP